MADTSASSPIAASTPNVAASSPADSVAGTAVDPVPGGAAGMVTGSGVASLATTALALVFVLALAWLLLRGLKRLQQRGGLRGGQTDAPQVMQSVGLGPRERLMTVHWRGRDYLLGVTAASVTLIDRADDGPGRPADAPHPD